jgi:hypothetical protein
VHESWALIQARLGWDAVEDFLREVGGEVPGGSATRSISKGWIFCGLIGKIRRPGVELRRVNVDFPE